MTGPVIQLFVNPRPRAWTRRRIAALRRAFEQRGATVLVTESRAGQLAIDPRADRICSAGGDGTLRHVVDAVRRSGRSIPVSAFPAGTINLLAMECGYPREPEAFVRRIFEAPDRAPHYMALIGATPMLVCASVGPDSEVVAGLSPKAKQRIGRAAYLLALARLLVRWPRHRLSLGHDGQRSECEAVYVAKGRYFAGPWSFAPDASVHDPWLHVVALDRATRWQFLRFACLLRLGHPLDGVPGIRRFICRDLMIAGAGSEGAGSEEAGRVPVQADGDVVGWLPVRIAVSPDTIDFA